MNTGHIPVTVAYGDGIGPEIMNATLQILAAAKANISPDIITVGEHLYLQGNTTGISDETWQSLHRTKVLLKGPITTPQGKGYKSLNVTLRKVMGLFANIRTNVAYTPYVASNFPNMNLTIIRENEEDVYTGIEHRPTTDIYECLKLVSRPGCERIIRYAFEYAKQHGRRKVTCMTKDNIMKLTDGIFHQIFNEIAADYPELEHDHYIIDIGAALIAAAPEKFDVVVTTNLYGDILSDVASQVSGSVGLSGSANIGETMAMFEAIHGSAPDIAGKNCANPSGLLHAAIQMLVYLQQADTATLITNAWLKTIEDGIHTADIYTSQYSTTKATTKEFAEAVIARLGEQPTKFTPVHYTSQPHTPIRSTLQGSQHTDHSTKVLVGVDLSIADNNPNINASITLINEVLATISSSLHFVAVASRGLQIWPGNMPINPYLNYYTCRLQTTARSEDLIAVPYTEIIKLINALSERNIDITKTENLYTFDGKPGFTLFQGQ